MRAALDSNLLVYAEGFGDEDRVGATRALLERLTDADLVVPVPCLGELFRVLTAKARRHGPLRRPSTGQLGCPGAERGRGGRRPTFAQRRHPVRVQLARREGGQSLGVAQ
jgi:hypothetical protein